MSQIMNQQENVRKKGGNHSNPIIMAGGIAAFAAGILFRRNIPAELSIFMGKPELNSVEKWYEFLQNNRFLGLIHLNILDIVNYVLVGIMFLAFYALFSKTNKGYAQVALYFGIAGTVVYFASNTSFSMLSLSMQYTSATTEEQRSLISAAGQAILSLNRFSDAISYPGTGGLISILFVGISGLISSLLMIKGLIFKRITGIFGLLCNGLDILYCMIFIFIPAIDHRILSISLIPIAGLFTMIWHIWAGLKLCQLARQKAS